MALTSTDRARRRRVFPVFLETYPLEPDSESMSRVRAEFGNAAAELWAATEVAAVAANNARAIALRQALGKEVWP